MPTLFEDLQGAPNPRIDSSLVAVHEIEPPEDAVPPTAQMVASVERFGILEPLMLVDRGSSKFLRYRIVAGRRRYRAACLAGLKKVPAVVVSNLDGDDARLPIWAISSNALRAPNLLSDVMAIRRLRAAGYNSEDICVATGLSPIELGQREALMLADRRLLDLLRDGQVSPVTARRVAGLPPQTQTALLDQHFASGAARLTAATVSEARQVDLPATLLPANLFEGPSFVEAMGSVPPAGEDLRDTMLKVWRREPVEFDADEVPALAAKTAETGDLESLAIARRGNRILSERLDAERNRAAAGVGLVELLLDLLRELDASRGDDGACPICEAKSKRKRWAGAATLAHSRQCRLAQAMQSAADFAAGK